MVCVLMPCYPAPLPGVNWHFQHGARFSGSVSTGDGVKKPQHLGHSQSSKKRWSRAGPSNRGIDVGVVQILHEYDILTDFDRFQGVPLFEEDIERHLIETVSP